MKIAVSPSLRNQIIRIILNQKKVKKIILYGSRSTGGYKETSDIDLAVMDQDWTDTDINLAKNALEEELRTPLKVDLVNYHTLSKPRLKDLILKEGQVLYESEKD